MHDHGPYNPLDKKNLGISVEAALLAKDPESLPPTKPFKGAGIYAIYYTGPFLPYKLIAERNRRALEWPIYVGSAKPEGGRTGGGGLDASVGSKLYGRLKRHGRSIEESKNLKLVDFYCRYLVVDEIWIPLGESLLIGKFNPLWNHKIGGFGNHAPGSGRMKQKLSDWDVLHPGRLSAGGLQASKEMAALEKEVQAFFESEKFKNVTV